MKQQFQLTCLLRKMMTILIRNIAPESIDRFPSCISANHVKKKEIKKNNNN